MKTVKKYLLIFLSSPEKIFITISLIAGLFSAILVPQLSVSDERMHFLRAYSLSQLSIKTRGCTYPPEVIKAAKDSDEKIYNSLYNTQPSNQVDGVISSCGSAATYNPILHTPQAIGIAIANIFNAPIGVMVLLGRFMNMVVYSALIFFAIRAAKIGKWPLLVISLFPTMIHTSGSLSADALNNAAVIAFISYILSIFFQRTSTSRRQIVVIFCLSVLVALTKTSNLPLLGLLIFLPSKLFGKNKHISHKWPIILALLGTIGLLTIGWAFISSHLPATPVTTNNPLSSNPLYFINILYGTYLSPFIGYSDVFFEGITDFLSAFQYSLPNSLVVVGWIALIISLLYKEKNMDNINPKTIKLLSILSVACIVIIILGITYVMYTAWAILPERLGPSAEYADGVQGRYFTAFLPLLIPPFLWIQRYMSVRVRKPYIMGSLIFTISSSVLAFYLYQSYSFAVISGAIS